MDEDFFLSQVTNSDWRPSPDFDIQYGKSEPDFAKWEQI
jgi:hypothetical protein